MLLQVVVVMILLLLVGFYIHEFVAIVRKRKQKKGRQENHAKLKKNNNGQIMYSMFAYKLYVHMFLCPRVCNCAVVSVYMSKNMCACCTYHSLFSL